MEKTISKDAGIGNKFLVTTVWKYSLIIALTLIGGYILLVGILLYPIIRSSPQAYQAGKALDAIKTITVVFGPWIAALVAFYFAGKQIEAVSEQLGKAQEIITTSIRADGKRLLEGKTLKEIMNPYDSNKHKIPHIELMNGGINSKTPLDKTTIEAIVSYAEGPRKDVRCFVIYTPEDKMEGIITPADIKEIQKIPPQDYGKKLLEDFTTDMIRLIKAQPAQSLSEILPSLVNFKVLPVFEGESIVGFVYRDDVFKLMSGVS